MFSEETLVDSSIWIDLFQERRDAFNKVADNPALRVHAFFIGEIAIGNYGGRQYFLDALKTMEKLDIADDEDVLSLIRDNKLHSRGIGYIDCHLLASAYLRPNTFVWTRDKHFHAAAVQLGVAFNPETA